MSIIAGGKLLVRPLFRLIAETRLREVFTAAALLLVIGIALLMTRVGLSPEASDSGSPPVGTRVTAGSMVSAPSPVRIADTGTGAPWMVWPAAICVAASPSALTIVKSSPSDRPAASKPSLKKRKSPRNLSVVAC